MHNTETHHKHTQAAAEVLREVGAAAEREACDDDGLSQLSQDLHDSRDQNTVEREPQQQREEKADAPPKMKKGLRASFKRAVGQSEHSLQEIRSSFKRAFTMSHLFKGDGK